MIRLLLVLFFTFCGFSAERPNVILIFADDMGYGDVGYHNFRKNIVTPNIDSIAKDGVYFTQGYVSASVCGPSRSGLLTGVYQQRFGCGENMAATGYPDKMKFPLSGVPRSQSMISELLKAQGYQTGMLGKWHLGMDKTLQPNGRGYDYFYGFLNGSHDYTAWTNKFAEKKGKWPLFRNDKMLPPAKNVYLTDLFSAEAVNFIDRNSEKPFFLYLAYNSVHSPWQVPQKYIDRVKHLSDVKDTQVFAAMVLAMDDGIGRVLAKLEEKKIADKTMLIFLSDNGTPRGQGLKGGKKDLMSQRGDHLMSSPGKLRGFKGDTYEGGIRIPFAMKWPGRIKPGSVYDLPVSSLDIVPTILAPLGVQEPKKGFEFDGVDLLPYLTKEKEGKPHELLYFRRDNDYAIRKGDWKLCWNDASGSQTIKLFNLKNDPEERYDIIEQNPELAQNLQDLFDSWDSTLPDNEWWGGPWNRNRKFSEGKRRNVAEFNKNLPDPKSMRRKIRIKK